MRSNLLKACLSLSLMAVAACGAPESEAPAAPELGESTQAVLFPPPVPPSGNILDSTAYLGEVALPGSVQTRFTTQPQYFSFSLHAAAGAQVKLEVTHLGSSMYLDTGLFVYGPRDASGTFGTTVLAQDDDAGYGKLSKISSLTLTQGGEYLVVVSTGTGAGKQFRLQADCLNGQCAALRLTGEALPATVQAKLDEGNSYDCDSYCKGLLAASGFAWSSASAPTLDLAVAAVDQQQQFAQNGFVYQGSKTFDELEMDIVPVWLPLTNAIRSAYWNGTEDVRVASFQKVWPLSDTAFAYHDYYVILFPESHKVLEFQFIEYD